MSGLLRNHEWPDFDPVSWHCVFPPSHGLITASTAFSICHVPRSGMPELPEAEVAARQIHARLVGGRVANIVIGRFDIIREGAASLEWYPGSVVSGVERYGKSVVIEFEKRGTIRYLVAELGMTGLLLFPSVFIKLPQHVHFTMSFADEQTPAVRYWNPRRFGRLSLLDRDELDRYRMRRFGCDPLRVTCEDFCELLRSKRRRLKALLMHQQVIAGIGNIYANEILFRARLNPSVIASRLTSSAITRLHHVMQSVLQDAIQCGGSSVKDFFAPDGTSGQYKRHHLVYGKEGHPCPNHCGRLIRRVQSERSSFFCPKCQAIRP